MVSVRKLIFSTLIILGLFGCEQKREVVEYFEDGKKSRIATFVGDIQQGESKSFYETGELKSHANWHNDFQDGLAKFYYKDGTIKSFSNWKRGIQDGRFQHNYSSGAIKDYGYFSEGQRFGDYAFYFENGKLQETGFYLEGKRRYEQANYYPDGTIQALRYHLTIHGKSKLVGFIIYDSIGEVTKALPYPLIKSEKDTIYQLEPHSFSITLKHPHFDSTRVFIGDFDDNFNTLNKDSLDTIRAVNHSTTINVETNNKGLNYLRGFIDNYKIVQQSGDTTKLMSKHVYFEYPYFVK